MSWAFPWIVREYPRKYLDTWNKRALRKEPVQTYKKRKKGTEDKREKKREKEERKTCLHFDGSSSGHDTLRLLARAAHHTDCVVQRALGLARKLQLIRKPLTNSILEKKASNLHLLSSSSNDERDRLAAFAVRKHVISLLSDLKQRLIFHFFFDWSSLYLALFEHAAHSENTLVDVTHTRLNLHTNFLRPQ